MLNLAKLLTEPKAKGPLSVKELNDFDILPMVLNGVLGLIESPDIEMASEIIGEIEKYENGLYEKVRKLPKSGVKHESSGAFSDISWLISQLFGYCGLICEVMTNRCMGEFAPSCRVRRVFP